jgi:sugar lactone lactonase YvrE
MDNSAVKEKTWVYTVIAVAGGVPSAPGPAGKVVGVKPLDPPGDLVGRHMADKGISLRWSPVKGGAFYNLYRKAPGESSFALIGSIQDTKTLDANVEEGKTYEYNISAVSSTSVESPKSATVSIEIVKVIKKVVKKFDYVGVEIEETKKVTGEEGYPLLNPSSIILDKASQLLYVNDANGSVQVLNTSGEFVNRIGGEPDDYSSDVRWGQPKNLNFDENGDLWVVYKNPVSIRLISASDSAVLAELTYEVDPDFMEWRPGTKINPDSATVDPSGRVWVSETTSNQIIIFEWDGNEYVELGRIGSTVITDENKLIPEEVIMTPTFLKMDPGGEVMWVVESLTAKLKAYDMEGNFVRHIGGKGPSLANLTGPKSFEFDKDGNVLVVDNLNNSITLLDSKNGDYLRSYVNDTEKKKFLGVAPGPIALDEENNQIVVTYPIASAVGFWSPKK